MDTIIIAASKKDATRYAAAHPDLAPVTIITPGSKTTGHRGPVHVTATGRAHQAYKTMLSTAAPTATIVHVEPNQAEETGDGDTAPQPQALTNTTKATRDSQNPDTEEVAGALHP